MATEQGNVVLIGMPGAGKSATGIVLAKILNKSFIDADLVIQAQCDKTLQKIIDAMGPDGFIEIENSILSDLAAENTSPTWFARNAMIWNSLGVRFT